MCVRDRGRGTFPDIWYRTTVRVGGLAWSNTAAIRWPGMMLPRRPRPGWRGNRPPLRGLVRGAPWDGGRSMALPAPERDPNGTALDSIASARAAMAAAAGGRPGLPGRHGGHSRPWVRGTGSEAPEQRRG